MTRFKALWRASPRKVLLAFGGLLIAAALAVGSGANFNSTSANPSNVFTAGTISHSNSKASAAILTASNMIPGGTSTGTVDIKNTGSASGTFTLAHTVAVDTPVSPGLSKKLILTISDLGDPTCVTGCPATTQLYTGTMFAMPATIALGTYAPGATHRYQFVVSFPDGGTGGADNAYQGAATTVEYDWSSTS
jgi:spore coat-associated protein N